jgi:YegS/Rv2252/BmrU family lipid kinase
MSARCFVIVNPAAGRGRARRAWETTIRPMLRSGGLAFDEVYEDRPGAAVPLADQATRDGYEVLAAVGGDGTIHEVLNGVLGPQGARRPALAVIPGGTGNDFARGVGIPKDMVTAARLLLDGGRRRLIDVGRVNDRYYGTISGVGFDAEVAAEVNRWPKWVAGTIVYTAGILKKLITYRCAPARITIDGDVLELPMFLIAAANTPWYAGGMFMAPHARPDDGQLEIILARDLTKVETLGVLPKVFSGDHLKHPKVSHRPGLEIRVESDVPLAIHADGETVGRVPAVFRALPQALEVIVPSDPTGR